MIEATPLYARFGDGGGDIRRKLECELCAEQHQVCEFVDEQVRCVVDLLYGLSALQLGLCAALFLCLMLVLLACYLRHCELEPEQLDDDQISQQSQHIRLSTRRQSPILLLISPHGQSDTEFV